MKLTLIFLIVLLIIPVFALTDQRKAIIGYKHKGVLYGQVLPNGARDLGGGLLSDENYGVTRFEKDGKYMLWLEKIIKRDNRGVPSWEVKDVLLFNPLKKKQQFLFSYSSPCKLDDIEDLNLIVLAQSANRSKNYQVLKAWRVNLEKETFESISSTGIICSYNQSNE